MRHSLVAQLDNLMARLYTSFGSTEATSDLMLGWSSRNKMANSFLRGSLHNAWPCDFISAPTRSSLVAGGVPLESGCGRTLARWALELAAWRFIFPAYDRIPVWLSLLQLRLCADDLRYRRLKPPFIFGGKFNLIQIESPERNDGHTWLLEDLRRPKIGRRVLAPMTMQYSLHL